MLVRIFCSVKQFTVSADSLVQAPALTEDPRMGLYESNFWDEDSRDFKVTFCDLKA